MDQREEILTKCDEESDGYGLVFDGDGKIISFDGKIQTIYNAMDEHGKQMSISFLKYALEKMRGHSVDKSGKAEVLIGQEWVTPEQLFENFL